jgi:16S rRNA (adenine1518-N6/adenine1519-N6)-dimethyltransferase
MANKSLGQHFLKNKSAIRAIAAALDPQPGETIIEIGPGHGELTSQMANGKWQMVLIEKDAALCADLRKEFDEPQVAVIEGDALATLPNLLTENNWKLEIGNWKLLGNIPYYITGHLLRIIGELPEGKKPGRCVFAIQKEVAERIVAKEGNMNRLAASVAYWADAKIVMTLVRQDFVPMPNVASAVILLNRKARPAFPDQNRYYAAVRALFAQPRKTILNNLSQAKGAASAKLSGKNKEKLADELRSVGILPEARPQNLNIDNVAKITKAFF